MKKALLALILSISLFAGFMVANTHLASAAALDCTKTDLTTKQQIQCGSCQAAGAATCDPATASGTVSDTIRSIINVLSAIAGTAAVIMIIVGGFRYVTSAGNAESTKSARNTIIYAVVGLVIVAMAQIVVHFVLNTTNNSDCVNGRTSSNQKC